MLQYQQWVVEGRAQGDVSGRGWLLTEGARGVVLVAIGLAWGGDRRDACLGAQSHVVRHCLQTLQRPREGNENERNGERETGEIRQKVRERKLIERGSKQKTSMTISASFVSPDMISLKYILPSLNYFSNYIF